MQPQPWYHATLDMLKWTLQREGGGLRDHVGGTIMAKVKVRLGFGERLLACAVRRAACCLTTG